MQYGRSNGIGAFLAIVIGISAFASWLYVCYPTTAMELADESRQSWSFIVLLGFVIVAVIGVTMASSVLQGVMMLLKSLVQLSLIVAIVVGGVMLWRRKPPDQTTPQPNVQYQETKTPRPVEPPMPEPAKGRWWDQNKSE